MYDPVCKFLVENYSADFANWLLGKRIALSTLNPSELSLEPIRADTLLLFQAELPNGDQDVLHIEFQTQPKPDIPFRMLDYWVRIHRIHRRKNIRQVVIYLSRTQSELVYQTRFESANTSHEFEVVRLWEQPFEAFLQSPGLLPFAILSKVEDPTAALQQVAVKIREEVDPQIQQGIGASAAILAGLVLKDNSLIQSIIGMDLLEQSSVYQGLKQEGRREGSFALVAKQLNRKVGALTPALEAKVRRLSVAQLESLGEVLLDFSVIADLERWLSEQNS